MAFTGIAALVTAETVTATLVLGAIANVGMIMTVVGAVTGNEKLTKIGGAMSLIGGVGGMVAGAGNAAAAGAAEGLAAGGADAATSAAWSTGAEGLGQDVISNIGGSATDIGGSIAQGASAGGLPDLAGALNPTDMRLAAGTQSTPGMAVARDAAAGTGSTVNDIAAPQGAQGPAGVEAPATPYDTPTDTRLNAGTQASPLAPQSSGSYFDRFSSWANQNKQLFSGGMQLVGGALNGANQRAMFNEKMALDRQRVNQTSYGNTVARFQPGIIAGARA